MPNTKMFATAIASAGLALGLATANAAEPVGSFARIEGVAVVSKGAQYVKAQEGMPLNEGDRLMVMEGGKAVLSFKDGCSYEVADNEILTIGATSTCASNAVGSYKVDPHSAVAQNPNAASQGYQLAAVGGGAGAGADLSWVPLAAVGVVAVAGIASDTGGDGPGLPPSP